MPSLGLH